MHIRAACLSRIPGSPTAGEVEKRHSVFRTSTQVSRDLVNTALRWHEEVISTEHVSSRFSAWMDRKALCAGWKGNLDKLGGPSRGDSELPLVILSYSSESRERLQPGSSWVTSSNKPRDTCIPYGDRSAAAHKVNPASRLLTGLLARQRWVVGGRVKIESETQVGWVWDRGSMYETLGSIPCPNTL